MTAWAAIIALAALVAALMLWRRRELLPVVAVALAVGLLGYAIAGRPALPSAPAPPPPSDPAAGPQFAAARAQLLANAADVGAWLRFADALSRQGRTAEAVEGLQLATRAMPDSPDLWVGLGNALTLHAEGMITPAARLAFDQASRLDPQHPAPRYFLGLAWLQAGKPAEAIRTWEALRRDSPPGAAWLPDVDRKLRAARMMQAAGVGG